MDGPIFENGNCNGGTNWLHSDASSREDASADKDDVKVEKYNTEEDRHASWDEARNEALHRKSSDHLPELPERCSEGEGGSTEAPRGLGGSGDLQYQGRGGLG